MRRRTPLPAAAILLSAALAFPTWDLAGSRFPGFVYTSSETIREAQDILLGLHYLEADRYKAGEWDDATRKAAREFQRDHFLKPSGQLDRDTMAVLSSHAPRSPR